MSILTVLKDTRSYGACFFCFALVFLFNLIFAGPLSSYLGSDLFSWLGRALYLVIFIIFLTTNLKLAISNKYCLLLAGLVVLVIFSFILTPGLSLKKVAFKDYVIPLIALFSTLYIRLDELKAKNIYQLLIWVSILQFPFVLQQYFFEAHSSSIRLVDWDLITGTFGFNSTGGGGNSAGFVLFQMFVLTMVFVKFRHERLERIEYIAVLFIFLTILLAETKIFIFLFLVMILSAYSMKELTNLSTLGKIIPAFLLIGALFINLYQTNTTDTTDVQTSTDYIAKIYSDYFEKQVIDYETGEVGRTMSVIYWIEEQSTRGWPIESYIGYGLTTSKLSNGYLSEAETFGSYINFASTQLTIYLWDIGIFGTFIYYSLVIFFITRTILLLHVTHSEYLFYLRSAALFAFFSSIIYTVYSATLHSSAISQVIYLISFMSIVSMKKDSAQL